MGEERGNVFMTVEGKQFLRNQRGSWCEELTEEGIFRELGGNEGGVWIGLVEMWSCGRGVEMWAGCGAVGGV